MSTKFRKCRRSLAAALDQAAEEVPCGSSSSPNCSLVAQNDTYILTLEDLVAKLEFENELNRVCSRSLQSKNPESSLHQREGATDMEEESTDRWVHDSNEEYSFLLDTILEIERDSDFTADCDVSSLELDLQLSP
ncbi:unnamed protein product [Leuciscus chuanchicus]